MGSRKSNTKPGCNCAKHYITVQRGQRQSVPAAAAAATAEKSGARQVCARVCGHWQVKDVQNYCGPKYQQTQQVMKLWDAGGQSSCPIADACQMYSCRQVRCTVENTPQQTEKADLTVESTQTDVTYDPNMTTGDKGMQFPEDPTLREVNVKETEVELREIRHRTGEREYEVVQRVANTRTSQDGNEPVTEYDEIIETKTPEEMDRLKSERAKTRTSVTKSERLSTDIPPPHVSVPEPIIKNDEEEDDAEYNENPSGIGQKFGKDENADNLTEIEEFGATVVKKVQRVVKKDVDVVVGEPKKESKTSTVKKKTEPIPEDDNKQKTSPRRRSSTPKSVSPVPRKSPVSPPSRVIKKEEKKDEKVQEDGNKKSDNDDDKDDAGSKKDNDMVFTIVSSMSLLPPDNTSDKSVKNVRRNSREVDEPSPFRSASQIVREYSDDEFDAESAPDNVSSVVIRRHYTKETESKIPGDLNSKKNIISEKTAEQRLKHYPEPEPEIEEPEPPPSPKRRCRRSPRRLSKNKYPSNDIVNRHRDLCRSRCYMGPPCSYSCNCPHCSYASGSLRRSYQCNDMPCYPHYGPQYCYPPYRS